MSSSKRLTWCAPDITKTCTSHILMTGLWRYLVHYLCANWCLMIPFTVFIKPSRITPNGGCSARREKKKINKNNNNNNNNVIKWPTNWWIVPVQPCFCMWHYILIQLTEMLIKWNMHQVPPKCEIWGCHSNDVKYSGLPGCCLVLVAKQFVKFQH